MKKILLPVLFLSLCSLDLYSQINLNLGLVVWYKYDGNAVDSSGNGINASPVSASLTTDRFGAANSAYSITGTSSYLTSPSSILMNTGNELSVAVWVKLTNSTNNQKIIGRTNGPPFSSGFVLGVENGHIYPEIWNSSGTLYSMNTSGTISSGTWTHLCFTYSGGQHLVAYVNGSAVDSVSVAALPVGSNSNNLIIGIAPWNLINFGVIGSVDDVRMYNRKINAGEVMALYNLTTGIPTVPQELQTQVFPNPSQDGIFHLKTEERISQVQVTNLLGDMVYSESENIYKMFTVNLSSLAPGAYIINMVAGDKTIRRKIIID